MSHIVLVMKLWVYYFREHAWVNNLPRLLASHAQKVRNDWKGSPFYCRTSCLHRAQTNDLRRLMGPLQLAVTWYKIHHAGEQATHWDIQIKENENLSWWSPPQWTACSQVVCVLRPHCIMGEIQISPHFDRDAVECTAHGNLVPRARFSFGQHHERGPLARSDLKSANRGLPVTLRRISNRNKMAEKSATDWKWLGNKI